MLEKYIGLTQLVPTEPAGVVIAARCPACRHKGIFLPVANVRDASGSTTGRLPAILLTFGQRVCPNPECRCHVFFTRINGQDTMTKLYPPETIDFDRTDLPPTVVSAIEEATSCHAIGCYRAAAMMVRKAMEELCEAQGATGGNLQQRIANLRTRVTVSPDLLAGLDSLRLLGNDAAHIEARTFNDVSDEEVALAIEIAKELLRAVYQHRDLVARLDALRRQAGTP